LVQKGTELSAQAKSLSARRDELATRLAEAKEQLLLLGDVDRDDELKGKRRITDYQITYPSYLSRSCLSSDRVVYQRRTMEGVVEWADKELTQAQYRLTLLQREREDNIMFSVEVSESVHGHHVAPILCRLRTAQHLA
jgi:hypothetical protein